MELTLQEIWEVYQAQDGKCALSGLPVSFEPVEASFRAVTERKTRTASIDRIDNSRGYTKENIRIVHQVVNLMKNTFTDEMFLEMCRRVTAKAG